MGLFMSGWASRQSGLPPRSTTVVVTAPALEPVGLAQVKNRLRITSTADDADLAGLIIAARRQVEKDLLGGCLVATVFDTYFDRAPAGAYLEIPRWPLQSVASVKTIDNADVETTFAAGEYLVDPASRPGRVILNSSAAWPTDLRAYKALVVRHTSGFSGTAKTLASLTRVGALATATTAAAHGYATGARVTVAGADQADYNGTFEITVTGAATFTFAVANAPATPATGVLTVTDLGIPELYTLAVMTLVVHYWDKLRTGMTVSGTESEVPFGYSALLSDAPVSMP